MTKVANTYSLPALNNEGRINFKDYQELVDYIEKQSVDNLPQIELPLIHRIAPGIYTREMFAPSGVLITSAIHKHEHFFFLLKGKILVIDEDGYRIVTAPYQGLSKPGTRRVGLVLEDVVWTTVHPIDYIEDKKYTEEEYVNLVNRIEGDVLIPRENKLLNT